MFKITAENSNKRVDIFLSEMDSALSRNYIQKLIEDGCLKINSELCKSKKHLLKENDTVELLIPEAKALEVKAEEMDLKILYEDEHILLVDKARGIVVHPAAGNEDGTLVNGLLAHCKDNLSSINGIMRPGIVHRIDKDTSGILIITKSDLAHKSLSEQFKDHSISRKYLAIVHNGFGKESGEITEPIGRDPKNRKKYAVAYNNSKPAETKYIVIEQAGKYSLVELQLETGRTHQIRVHMAYIKHPVLGDPLYGPKKNEFGLSGQMLHAYHLGFTHPSTNERMEFNAELPADFNKVKESIFGKKRAT
ncbi:MAG: RluA family pseudouridine synthase [Anaerovoracaceae bacterium]